MSSSQSSPCAACKFLRRKCTQECAFALYFPPEEPNKFSSVHKVFGASNVAKILNEIHVSHREDTVNSLVYEAEARLKDPVYGCVGLISVLQHRLKQVQNDVQAAKQELSSYIGPTAMMPNLREVCIQQQFANIQQQPILGLQGPGTRNLQQQPMLGLQVCGTLHDAHFQQQLYEAQQQQLVDATREQQMFRIYEQQQQLQELQHHQQLQQHQQIDLMRYNRGYDVAGPSGQVNLNLNPSGFTHLTCPSLALSGSYDYSMYQIQQEPQLQDQHHPGPHLQQFIPDQLLVQQQQPQQPQPPLNLQSPPQPQPQDDHQGEVSEEGRRLGEVVCLSDDQS